MIKLGIIGCGGMGGHHARTIHSMDGATLVGVADTIAAKATELATELGIEAYTDFHDLLPAVDGVSLYLCLSCDCHWNSVASLTFSLMSFWTMSRPWESIVIHTMMRVRFSPSRSPPVNLTKSDKSSICN